MTGDVDLGMNQLFKLEGKKCKNNLKSEPHSCWSCSAFKNRYHPFVANYWKKLSNKWNIDRTMI